MNQLFLAVSKAVTGCCKGCLLSRYGPARSESILFQIITNRKFLPSLEAPAPPPTTADMATLTNELPFLPYTPHANTRKACFGLPIPGQRKTTPYDTTLLRMLGFNAFEAPLLQEGVY